MLDQAMTALASAAGTAVARAAGTDAWHSFRERVARLFSRGSAPDAAQAAALDRLDRTAAQLERAAPDTAEQVRDAVVAAWETRFGDLLEDLDEVDRDRVAAQLRNLVALAGQAGTGVRAEGEGIAIGGDMNLHADHGSVVGWNIGNVTMGTGSGENPPVPGPSLG